MCCSLSDAARHSTNHFSRFVFPLPFVSSGYVTVIRFGDVRIPIALLSLTDGLTDLGRLSPEVAQQKHKNNLKERRNWKKCEAV